jgi:hypothetical protein
MATEKQIAFARDIHARIMGYFEAEAAENHKYKDEYLKKVQRVEDYLRQRPPDKFPFFWIEVMKSCRSRHDAVTVIGARLRIIDAFKDVEAAIAAAVAKGDRRMIADMINAIDRRFVAFPSPQAAKATRQRLYEVLKMLCQ